MGNRKMNNDFDTPENKCINCGYILDKAMNTTGEGGPEDGDITICINCSHIMAFGANLELRELTAEEMYDVAGDAEMLKAIRIIKLVRETRK
jgi:hypothetical protein